MRSPLAPTQTLRQITLEDHLIAFQCPETGGIFLPVQNYFRWLSHQPERLAHLPASDSHGGEPVEDSQGPKICPESGRIMQRFKVGHGFDFHLDRSPSGSIWLDQGEWEALRARQFHDELHLIFTAPWQGKIRDSESREIEEKVLTERFSPELLENLEALKTQLADHPHRAFALAWLQR